MDKILELFIMPLLVDIVGGLIDRWLDDDE